MDRSNSLPWLISGVLFIGIIIVGVLWINTSRELESVLADNSSDIRSQRDEIMDKCTGPNADQEACDEALTDLANILREFSAELSVAATSSAQIQ